MESVQISSFATLELLKQKEKLISAWDISTKIALIGNYPFCLKWENIFYEIWNKLSAYLHICSSLVKVIPQMKTIYHWGLKPFLDHFKPVNSFKNTPLSDIYWFIPGFHQKCVVKLFRKSRLLSTLHKCFILFIQAHLEVFDPHP